MVWFKWNRTVAVEAPEFIEVRSGGGAAIHIANFEDSKEFKPALCGYDRWVHTNTVKPVTATKVLDSIPFQHEGWFWCKKCASEITAVPVAHLP